MSVSRTSNYAARLFRAGELTKGLRSLLRAHFPPEYDAEVRIFRTLPDGTKHNEHRKRIDDLESLCDVRTQGSFHVEFGKPLGSIGVSSELSVEVYGRGNDQLQVTVNGRNAEQLALVTSFLEESLGLRPAPLVPKLPEDPDDAIVRRRDLWSLEERVGELETRVADVAPITCFVSFQFSEPSLSYANVIKHFLELIGLRVVTGQGYEPRLIQDKVRDRLRSSIDLVVLIEVAGRKSTWTRDEIAVAQTPGVFLIPLVEDGAEFDRGIFGDHEYVTFSPGHIGDALVGLLEGITYVRSTRAAE